MTALKVDGQTRQRALLALNLAVRVAIVFWLAEAWIFQDDPRFAGKAIPERNAVIVGSLSMLFPAIWWRRSLSWSAYPLGLDVVYLSIFALDMAGNSFNLYERFEYFDLIPHFHSPGAAALVIAVWWAHAQHGGGRQPRRPRWLLEGTLLAAGIATMLHVVLEAQEFYTDRLAGTHNVEDIADVVNDLAVGLVGALLYPLVAARWFLPLPARFDWRSGLALAGIALFVVVVLADPGPRFSDWAADRFATPLPAPLSAEQRQALLVAARDGAGDGEASSRPVQVANAPEALAAALAAGSPTIEGDVGMVGVEPVMRHDPRDPAGMRLSEWLEVVAAAGVDVVKLDVKRDRVGPVIDAIRTAISVHGLEEARLKLNADVLEGPGAYAHLSWPERIYLRLALKLETDDLAQMARAFPDAAVSIGAWTRAAGPDDEYTARHAEAVVRLAEELRAAGTERVFYAARYDLLTDEFVRTLAASDVVIDVWSSTEFVVPEDVEAEAGRLRERYGDALGTIDLRAVGVGPD